MHSRSFRCGLVGLLAFALNAFSTGQLGAADNPQGKEISDVVVIGNKARTSNQILALLQTKVGKTYDVETIQEDVRRLYNTKWFTPNGIRLLTVSESDGRIQVIVFVSELLNTVKEIVYEGADHLTKSELQAITTLNKGEPLNPYANKLARRAIRDRY